jgi:hypothetical protein
VTDLALLRSSDFLRKSTTKKAHPMDEPTHINLEHLFDNLFALKDRFENLGMTIKDGKVCLADLDEI